MPATATERSAAIRIDRPEQGDELESLYLELAEAYRFFFDDEPPGSRVDQIGGLGMAENVREGDSPAEGDASRPGKAPEPASRPDEGGPQEDEHAAMRQTVAQEYADALGKRYEPPSEENDTAAKPRFDKAEIDKSKIAEAIGGTAKDAERIEAQIRDGVRNGTPVATKTDRDGRHFSVDVPVTGPAGTTTVRTSWIVEPGSDRPRLTTMALQLKAGEQRP